MTVHATQQSGTGTQPDRFVVFEGATLDDGQASGRWLSAADPVEVQA